MSEANPERKRRVCKRLSRVAEKTCQSSFKTITCDNGCENLDFECIERSIRKGKRTRVCYTHPFGAWERGTNENINKLNRRFIPKGADIGKYTKAEIRRIEWWISHYPGRVLGGMTAAMMVTALGEELAV